RDAGLVVEHADDLADLDPVLLAEGKEQRRHVGIVGRSVRALAAGPPLTRLAGFAALALMALAGLLVVFLDRIEIPTAFVAQHRDQRADDVGRRESLLEQPVELLGIRVELPFA